MIFKYKRAGRQYGSAPTAINAPRQYGFPAMGSSPHRRVSVERESMTCSKRKLVRQGLCAALLYAAVATVNAAPGAAVVLPALTQPASGEHHVGKVIWADLVTPDLEAAKHFYGALFS